MKLKQAESHIKECVKHSNNDIEAFFRACFLAIVSIRVRSNRFWKQNWINNAYTEYMITSDIDRVNNLIPDFCAMTFKRSAIEEIEKRKTELFYAMKRMNSSQFHELLCSINGLGPVKAGFIVQMTKGKLGCLDAVNIRRFNINRVPDKPATYREYLKNLSPCRNLWRDWCVHVAERDDMNALALSKAHAEFVVTGRISNVFKSS